MLDHRHGHDVEDPAGVCVLGIGKFIEACKVTVGDLYLSIHLATVVGTVGTTLLAMIGSIYGTKAKVTHLHACEADSGGA
jgi:hypothetical protein